MAPERALGPVMVDLAGLALGAEEREMLQDLIVAAANDALRKARELMTQEMGRMMGGLGLPPGLFRPGGP